MKHEIIYTKSNAFILTDVFENQTHCWHLKKQEILEVKGVGESSGEIHHEKGWNKPGEVLFIAAHKPLNDAPVLEGVPLLPEFSQGNDVEKEAKDYADNSATCNYEEGINVGKYQGFIEGYNKAKETYEYTLGDLRRAFTTGRNLIVEKRYKFGEWEVFTKFIDSLQQPKRPKYFECEYKPITPHKYTVDDHLEVELKTITNSKGQTELVGEFIYE